MRFLCGCVLLGVLAGESLAGDANWPKLLDNRSDCQALSLKIVQEVAAGNCEQAMLIACHRYWSGPQRERETCSRAARLFLGSFSKMCEDHGPLVGNRFDYLGRVDLGESMLTHVFFATHKHAGHPWTFEFYHAEDGWRLTNIAIGVEDDPYYGRLRRATPGAAAPPGLLLATMLDAQVQAGRSRLLAEFKDPSWPDSPLDCVDECHRAMARVMDRVSRGKAREAALEVLRRYAIRGKESKPWQEAADEWSMLFERACRERGPALPGEAECLGWMQFGQRQCSSVWLLKHRDDQSAWVFRFDRHQKGWLLRDVRVPDRVVARTVPQFLRPGLTDVVAGHGVLRFPGARLAGDDQLSVKTTTPSSPQEAEDAKQPQLPPVLTSKAECEKVTLALAQGIVAGKVREQASQVFAKYWAHPTFTDTGEHHLGALKLKEEVDLRTRIDGPLTEEGFEYLGRFDVGQSSCTCMFAVTRTREWSPWALTFYRAADQWRLQSLAVGRSAMKCLSGFQRVVPARSLNAPSPADAASPEPGQETASARATGARRKGEWVAELRSRADCAHVAGLLAAAASKDGAEDVFVRAFEVYYRPRQRKVLKTTVRELLHHAEQWELHYGQLLAGQVECLGRLDFGESKCVLLFLVKREYGPVYWAFNFYSPGDRWRLSNVEIGEFPETLALDNCVRVVPRPWRQTVASRK